MLIYSPFPRLGSPIRQVIFTPDPDRMKVWAASKNPDGPIESSIEPEHIGTLGTLIH